MAYLKMPIALLALFICLEGTAFALNADGPGSALANQMVEWTFTSTRPYKDPFNQIELNVTFTTPSGKKLLVPAFWDGGDIWHVRYSSTETGIHHFSTVCSDSRNTSLHAVAGKVEIKPYVGTNAFYLHGPIQVAKDKNHFEHADGTPFFWLSDSWYMSLCKRLKWSEEFNTLTQDRVAKGFNVVQVVAGLYPDMGAFDERSANEGGFPWETNFTRINPKYFQAADQRIAFLVDSGLAPCLFGAWGYYLPWMGEKKMKQHWRYLVARYGAYPMFWCIAGEATRPWYLSNTRAKDQAQLLKSWTKVTRYVRQVDPYHRPLSIHPPIELGRQQVSDPNLLDFEMLQSGHDDRASVPYTISLVRRSRSSSPRMPTIDAEVCYEGILGNCEADVQRYMEWRCLLGGTAGHSYGANGVWQINQRNQPFGTSPGNNNWGNTCWQEAMRLPGSGQMGLGRHILEKYKWWEFDCHPEWVSQDSSEGSFKWGNWIWSPDAESAFAAPSGRRCFRKSFTLTSTSQITQALLHLAVDDNAEVFLNGTRLGGLVGWNPYRELEVTSLLKSGPNILAIHAVNIQSGTTQKNPAGLLVNLDIHFNDDSRKQIVSDASWFCSEQESSGWQDANFDDRNWTSAKSLAEPGQGPWKILTSPNYHLNPGAAGIVKKIRLIYLATKAPAKVEKLEAGINYRATFINPQNGNSASAGIAKADADQKWTIPTRPPQSKDWLLLLEAE
ncbi:DUF4038 domain-containing protein [Pedosphaera parvula]|uniref:Alpha-L-rhamnosidase domain protein n=1 Tax=Pedosphaera parvula (strain Ellin514) TaxID=320771 RepID=B9XFK0_PEDPL|nr:DUF4038 domain-containing protein [Pedosphaera parvula]EEF61364.1 alpha-L-rhamnosidase domain protein [Pedosphaera parvula Ellin514]